MNWKNRFLFFFSYMLFIHNSVASKTEITNVTVPPEVKNIQMQVNVKNKNSNNMIFEPIINFFNKFKPKVSIKNYIEIKEFAKIQSMALNDFFIEYCKQNKTKITVVGFSSCYLLIFYKLLFCAHTILSQNNWAAWKNSVPFDMLRVMPQQELAKELLYAVQKHYQTTENLADFLLPIISFLRDVDLEIKILNQFITLHYWLKKTHFSFLFPKQESLVKKAHEKIQRLIYLKGIFLDWVTDYKIAINTRN